MTVPCEAKALSASIPISPDRPPPYISFTPLVAMDLPSKRAASENALLEPDDEPQNIHGIDLIGEMHFS